MIETAKSDDGDTIVYIWRNAHENIFSYRASEILTEEPMVFFSLLKRLIIKHELENDTLDYSSRKELWRKIATSAIDAILSLKS
jgi:hypothetical protein